MAEYTDRIQDASPATEIWWCGDPDFDTEGDSDWGGTDSWQRYILENAAAHSVGAIVAHEDPSIGTGNERAADGQSADRFCKP